MASNVEISPEWLQDIYFGEMQEVSSEVIEELKEKGLIIVIEAVRAIDAFEVYNDLMCTKILAYGVIRKYPYVEFKKSKIVYAGVDGANFCVAFKLEK